MKHVPTKIINYENCRKEYYDVCKLLDFPLQGTILENYMEKIQYYFH